MAHPNLLSINLQAGGGGSDSIFPVSELLALVSPPVVTLPLKTFGCDIYPDSTFHAPLPGSPDRVQGEKLDVTFWGPLASALCCLGIP